MKAERLLEEHVITLVKRKDEDLEERILLRQSLY